ncbi:WcbI family polysaccharide biosynthesis putative acetyltransferase [uncultured Umboniibacter sp.]|uniref:WcbI family polysaccharide biosynthesis putative acetyltransferase n=1 Tax=uncultured Umboniibacter sp. TaxID=1798917 RepID=UPI002617B96C|nr:WcbI family polysaccharide biosynthesis putative acetyltransferase [uncultured Umboniibacter sp.]
MTKKKVVVVGNCQARPIAALLEQMSDQVEVIKVAIVHLLNKTNEEEYRQAFRDADFIIAQLVAPNYPCEFVRTVALKELYPKKVITIVNLFYAGYTPDWFYIRRPNFGTLRGPMGDYHNKTIFKAWLERKTKSEAMALVTDKSFNSQEYLPIVHKSLVELKNREQEADVKIAYYIEENYLKRRLFFTFNHPSKELLVEYTKQVLIFLDIIVTVDSDIDMREPLNQFIPQVNVAVPISIDRADNYKGSSVLTVDGWNVDVHGSEIYSLRGLVDVFYSIYSQNETELDLLSKNLL